MKLASVPSTVPEPPYPADVSANGWRFELDLLRVIQSDTWQDSPPDLRPWLLMLWAMAWIQRPAGSLPEKDDAIAARIGMPLGAFQTHRTVLMSRWRLHSDRRWYHPVVTEFVLGMCARRQGLVEKRALERARKARQRAEEKRKGENVPRTSRGSHAGVTRDGENVPRVSRSMKYQGSTTEVKAVESSLHSEQEDSSKDLFAKDANRAPKKAAAKKVATHGTRLTADWNLPDDWKAWTLTYRPDWDETRVIRESLVFRDYWHAKAGANARKVDWLATWRNWIRKAT